MTVNYFELGASLYTPADHNQLLKSLTYGIGEAKSIVVCTEDAVSESKLPEALANLEQKLAKFKASPTKTLTRLVRPRNPAVFAQLLAMDGIEKIDGFILPKATPASLNAYRKALKEYKGKKRFALMPTLETSDVLNQEGLRAIRVTLDSFKDDIACVRIGGNDLMNLLGIKRMPGLTIYETPIRNIIDNIIVEFRPYGYELSAPVFDYIDDRSTLAREMLQDLSYGFFAKTAIHPTQVPVIEQAFFEYIENNAEKARRVIDESDRAVYQEDGQMMEVTCHGNWARRTHAFSEAMKQHNTSMFPTKKIA
jgi:citrate lyase beta subunit